MKLRRYPEGLRPLGFADLVPTNKLGTSRTAEVPDVFLVLLLVLLPPDVR